MQLDPTVKSNQLWYDMTVGICFLHFMCLNECEKIRLN